MAFEESGNNGMVMPVAPFYGGNGFGNADGGYSSEGSYAEEYYVRPDGSYARGRGPGAKRDSMGRYSSEGGVDEHTKKELMKMIERM